MLQATESLADGQVLVSRGQGIALVELNRPEQFNALTLALLDGLRAALEALSDDPAVHAIVLTGRGKAFCAGLDLNVLTEDNSVLARDDFLGYDAPLMQAFARCCKPLIGAINGVAVTGGFELALACDFIYASEKARFADTHARVGLLPGWGLSQKLPRLVGINRAREISFTGDYFSAQEACDWGLVNRVFPADDLLESTLECARQIATCIPDTLEHIKAMMNEGWEDSLANGLAMEGQRSRAYNSKVDVSVMEERLAQLRARGKRS
ncbi:enoyl-CoA hydratase [Mangrovimicrobium sediminis]|uniref:Enoyl-CoA hydratase n=1 Tax=Mangrovimicrobium sediminis TaxID=2562682 RepID=A0A4Z0M7C9_9GAMM|nr:enoyl-CoA hydratase [Haliea sp. SAOS-164]TGD75306.1 enoyl-CoA hydratase [Haliea sp. SAOS-164]